MSGIGRYQTDESHRTYDFPTLCFAHADGIAKMLRGPMALAELFILPSGLAKVGHSAT
jgi:hypothetical protein